MSDLTFSERRKLEELLGMGSGYVLDFSNRTIEEFVLEVTGRNIYDRTYDYGSGSKANRLRAFWQKEDNRVVGKLMHEMLQYGNFKGKEELYEACRCTVDRLLGISTASAGAFSDEALSLRENAEWR